IQERSLPPHELRFVDEYIPGHERSLKQKAALVPNIFVADGNGGIVGEDSIGLSDGGPEERLIAFDQDPLHEFLEVIFLVVGMEDHEWNRVGAVENPDALPAHALGHWPDDHAEREGVSPIIGLDDLAGRDNGFQLADEPRADENILLEGDK